MNRKKLIRKLCCRRLGFVWTAQHSPKWGRRIAAKAKVQLIESLLRDLEVRGYVTQEAK